MKTNVFFDMDGVLCEYSYDYLNPRIYETLKPMLNRILLLNTLIDNGYSVFVLSSLPHCSEDIDYIGDAPEVFEYINSIVDSLVKDSVTFINACQEISKIVGSEEDVDNIQQLLSIALNNKFVKFKIKDINSFYSNKYIISILEYEDGERGYSISFNSDMDAIVNNFKQ